MYQRRSCIAGLTLIEMSISLVISFIVLIVLSSVYVASTKNFSFIAGLYSIEGNARYTLQFLENEISHAGYLGCVKMRPDFPLINHTAYDIGGRENISATFNTLTIKHAFFPADTLFQTMQDSTTLYVNSYQHYKVGDVVVVSDCQSAEIYQIKTSTPLNSHQTKIIASTNLNKQFSQAAHISHFEKNTYFIQPTVRQNTLGEKISALYQRNLKQRQNEMVEGVESLFISYDVMPGLENITPGDNTDWSSVTGIRIRLLLSSTNTSSIQKIWFGYAALI
jgi:Tfp pilus assembly protein PilW